MILLVCMPWAALSPAARPPATMGYPMHVSALAVLALLSCLVFQKIGHGMVAVFFVFVYSAFMELLQHFSPSRHGTIEDVVANGLGCLAGLVIFLVLVGLRHMIIRRIRRHSPDVSCA